MSHRVACSSSRESILSPGCCSAFPRISGRFGSEVDDSVSATLRGAVINDRARIWKEERIERGRERERERERACILLCGTALT